MTNTKITRKAIENAIRIMVATAITYKAFVSDFYAYAESLDSTNYVVIWDDITDVFEVYNVLSKKSTFLDFSHVIENMD